jgi:nicotinate-nucleotide adenylyltransferase
VATPAQHRLAMVERAFEGFTVAVTIDQQEIRRERATYTIDTLRALREELGPEVSIAFLLGADQLQQLHTWKEWRSLFDYAHLCAASRPGFALDDTHVPPEVRREFTQRAATPQQIRETPHGLAYLAENLSVDISATQIRIALERGGDTAMLLPPRVLDYINQRHLYT